MIGRRTFVLTLGAGPAFLSPTAQAQLPPGEIQRINQAIASDPILTAISAEVSRFAKLRTLGEVIYYVEVSVDDAEAFSVSATLGAAFQPNLQRLRPVRIQVRVAEPAFDNTGSIYSDISSGARLDSGRLPLDGNVYAMRQELWLALDRSYRSAVEALGRKRAAVRGITVTDPLPDFWPAPHVFVFDPPGRLKLDEKLWTARAKSLSAVFKDFPAITGSSVDFELAQGTWYHLNTLGSCIRTPDNLVLMRARASQQAADGMLVYDGVSLAASSLESFPDDAAQRAAVERVARNVRDLASAAVGEAYTGPVLFEGPAAAQAIAEVWGAQLGANRRPVSEPNRPVNFPGSELEARLNARVLPDGFNLVDDPTLESFQGKPLLGHYKADLDGVAAQRVELVQNGTLKTLLVSRQPIKGVSGPNGHARLPGGLGLKVPRISNLFLTAPAGLDSAALKQKLIDQIKTLNKPYGIIVRKTDFPSFASIDELRRAQQRATRAGGGRPTAPPVLLYRVYADGREELVRGLRFRSFGLRAFRDILATGDSANIFSYIDNGAAFALVGAGSFVVGCSASSPSLLFEEVELETAADDLAKPPLVPPPAVS